ncbi:hypothetical protein [Marinoscillum sp. MHG1-6]|uniref:hypothetical protein n=1 Tax=Marinoscillum sp. MHG1-6 TaxID=2959627 RepID=UPI002157BFDA|nr:hypothetical protein [Marinoscillum sp. MHG1-6]
MSKKREDNNFKKSKEIRLEPDFDETKDGAQEIPEEVKEVDEVLTNSKFKEDFLTQEENEEVEKAVTPTKSDNGADHKK